MSLWEAAALAVLLTFYMPGVLMCYMMSCVVLFVERTGFTRSERRTATAMLCGMGLVWPVPAAVWCARRVRAAA